MILIILSYRSGKTEQAGIRSRGILEVLAEFLMMRNSTSYGGLHHAELRIMRNSASCGTHYHAELSIMQNSTCYFPQGIGSVCGKESQYSANMRNSALDFRFLWSIQTNFLLHAELRSIGIFAELRKKWKSNGEFSASNIFHFLNLLHYIFRIMRKFSPNTPQVNFRLKTCGK